MLCCGGCLTRMGGGRVPSPRHRRPRSHPPARRAAPYPSACPTALVATPLSSRLLGLSCGWLAVLPAGRPPCRPPARVA